MCLYDAVSNRFSFSELAHAHRTVATVGYLLVCAVAVIMTILHPAETVTTWCVAQLVAFAIACLLHS